MLKKVILFTALLVAALLFVACPAAQKGPGVELNVNIGSEPPEMDPQITTDTVSIQIINMVFEGLVRYGKDGGYIPGMAEKWDVSPDGKTYTFTLRKGIKWSNGTPVTAADFEYGIKRALDPKTASQYAYILYDIKNAEKANAGEIDVDQVGVEASGNKVVFTLERPLPYFLSILTFPTAMPCNQKFVESLGGSGYGADADKLIYNGPWTIKEWTHDDHVTLAKNPNYWNKKEIKLDTVNMAMISDSNTAIQMFFDGQFDIIGIVGTRKQDFVDKGYPINTYSDGACFYLEFNTTDKLLKNANIRKALSYAVDRKAFVTDVLKDASQPALAYVVPILPGSKGSFRSEVGDLIKDNDPAAAKAAWETGLKELGLSGKQKMSMLVDDSDRAKAMGAALQEMWRKNLGVDVVIEPLPFKARLQKMTDKDFQIVFAGWGPDYNDPMTFIDVFLSGSGNNHTYFANATYDDLVKKAKAEPNAETRMNYMKDAERLLMQEMPIAPIYFRYRWWTTQEGISGVVRRAIGGDPDLYWTTKTVKK
jgi:oligopeptide transport system substrate-binding protein